jgi:formylglycine-generating enzyme required for sulfatase activity
MLPPPEPLDLFPDPPPALPSPLAITGDDPVLALSRKKPSTSTQQTFSAAPPPPAKPSRARDLLPVVVIAGGIAVGLSSGLALGMRAPAETHAEPAAAEAAPGTSAAPSSVRSPRASASAAPSAAGASFCPRGMVASGEPPICIGRTEVTVGEYARCVDEGACAPLGRTAAQARRPEVQKARDTLCNGRSEHRDYPANCVTYRSAQNYCAFSDARLPTETEWTRARQAAKLPAGTEPGENLCRWECAVWWHDHGLFAPKPLDGDDGYEATSPVTAFIRKETSGMPLDLEGNVAEWVDSDPTVGAVALGSSFASAALPGDVAERVVVDGGAGSEAIGFRCVSDP